MNSKGVSKVVFFLILITIVLLLALTLCLLTFFLIPGDEEENSHKNVLKEYKYRRYDPLSNEMFSGITRENEFSSDLGFLSYEDSVGSLILISEFGSVEYHCTGKCYCENINSRRTAFSISFVKRLSYLAAAMSSVLAVNFANDYFSDRCVEELSTNCDEVSIRSEVESCEEIVHPNRKEELERYGEDYEEYEEDTVIFWCKGNCLPNLYNQEFPYDINLADLYESNYMTPVNQLEVDIIGDFGCEKLEIETEVWLDPNHDEDEYFAMKLKSSEESQQIEVESEFIFKHLEKYCIQHSVREGAILCGDKKKYEEVCSKGKMDYEEMKTKCLEECEGKMNVLPLCVSHDNNSIREENKSVKCVKMEKKTEMYRDQVYKKKGIKHPSKSGEDF